MDDHAYNILRGFFSPDEDDNVRDGMPPYMAPENLLDVYLAYRWLAEKNTGTPVAPPNPDWAGWAEDGVTALEALTALRVLIDDLAGAFGWLIHDARQDDASWADLGAALGITKQAAWERFRDYAERKDWKTWPNYRQAALLALGDRPIEPGKEESMTMTQHNEPCPSLHLRLLDRKLYACNLPVDQHMPSGSGPAGDVWHRASEGERIPWTSEMAVPVPWPKDQEPPAGIDILMDTNAGQGSRVYLGRVANGGWTWLRKPKDRTAASNADSGCPWADMVGHSDGDLIVVVS